MAAHAISILCFFFSDRYACVVAQRVCQCYVINVSWCKSSPHQLYDTIVWSQETAKRWSSFNCLFIALIRVCRPQKAVEDEEEEDGGGNCLFSRS